MAKRGKKQNRKTNQETVYNIPDGFLKGELISHPRYGKGFITDINSDGTFLCARFDFDGLIHNISLPDELPLLFTCDQNESITSFLNQRFGCYECRRCKKRMWPHTFTDTQKAIYDTDQICEKCDREKYECPICGDRFFLADGTMLEKDLVYICHSCFQEYFTGIPEPFQREAYSYEYFQEKGMSRTEFYQYLIYCNDLCSIIHAFSFSRRMEDDGKYFLTLLKPKLEVIMRINGVPGENIAQGIDKFPLAAFSAWIYCDKGVVEDRIVSFSKNTYCVVTTTAFRSMIETCIRNYIRNGKWITFLDREHEPVHSISEDTYDEAVNMLWTRGLELSNEIDDFKSYEELSEFYTRQDGIPDYESMSETLESSLDDFFRTIDRQESLQAQVNRACSNLSVKRYCGL